MSMLRNDETEGETGSETTKLVSRRVSPANFMVNHWLGHNETTKRISTHSPHTPQWVAWVKPSAPVVMVCVCACRSCSVSEQGSVMAMLITTTGGHAQTVLILATVPVGMKKMVSHGRNHADYFPSRNVQTTKRLTACAMGPPPWYKRSYTPGNSCR